MIAPVYPTMGSDRAYRLRAANTFSLFLSTYQSKGIEAFIEKCEAWSNTPTMSFKWAGLAPYVLDLVKESPSFTEDDKVFFAMWISQ